MNKDADGFIPEYALIDRREFTRAISLLAAGAATAGLWLPGEARAQDAPVAQTTAGKVRGLIETGGVNVFRGVPYGASTAGKNRFKAALRPEPWTGILDTLAFGPAAPQDSRGGGGGRKLVISEDCLKLNIWTRGLKDGRKRPVMVWLHEGGFGHLSGNSNDGGNLARRGDVVTVTFNHRLNMFGYVHLSDLPGGEAYPTSGNNGLLDIVHLLKWVRDNIAYFGGDPGNVTIFGESGGGRKAANLLAMPAAKGLFHRAIIESGPSIHTQSRDRATALAIDLLEHVGLKPADIDKLQDVPLEKLVAAQAEIEAGMDEQGHARLKGGLEHTGWTPTSGFGSLPTYSFDPVAPECSADVPLIIGTNHHEWALQSRPDPGIYDRTLTEKQLADLCDVAASRGGPRVMETYARLYPGVHPAVRFILLATARIYRQDSIALAERKSYQKKAPVYMYRFDYEDQRDPKMLAHHGIEVPFVFDNTSRGNNGGQGPVAAALADKVSDAWIAFARTGNPNVSKLPHWAPYDAQSRATMVFNEQSQLVNDPDSEERRLWATM